MPKYCCLWILHIHYISMTYGTVKVSYDDTFKINKPFITAFVGDICRLWSVADLEGNQGWRGGGGGLLATTYLKTNCLNSALIYPDIGICHSTIYSAAASKLPSFISSEGGGPRVVVSTAAFHARVRGSVPGLGGLKETKLFLPHPRVKVSIVGSLRDREVACSASDRQGSNFESCVWEDSVISIISPSSGGSPGPV